MGVSQHPCWSSLTSKPCDKEWESTLQKQSHCVQALGLQPSFLWKGEVHWRRANKWLQWFIICGPWSGLKVPELFSTVEHGLMFYFSPVCKSMRLYKWNVWFMSCSFNIGTKDAGVNTVYFKKAGMLKAVQTAGWKPTVKSVCNVHTS